MPAPAPNTTAAEAAPQDLRKALQRAFHLGQTYWQQADSESTSQHRKADETRAKFDALVEEVSAASSAAPAPAEPVAWMWQHDETGMTGFVQHASAEELTQWERMNRPRKIVTPIYASPVAAPALLRIEPTDAMVDAACDDLGLCAEDKADECIRQEYRVAYRAMVLAAPAPTPLTDEVSWALNHAQEWIGSAPHGDNCYVSDHYEGDPGDRCNCGKESALASVERGIEALAAAASPAQEGRDARDAARYRWLRDRPGLSVFTGEPMRFRPFDCPHEIEVGQIGAIDLDAAIDAALGASAAKGEQP